ncbi:uncharacterized protein METZ01_LOCUS200474 [marine metagenome]|jgi:uncharacterized membrane protein|uniref:Uncharacterized protein n=1 Tax=marine metagenome TaxID=408172 RepID=A0A382EAG6_9ZZZZ|tara:strand:+ start:167 stop:379 length:213 start_codon:yes stop_codon:yes gene_type:complete
MDIIEHDHLEKVKLSYWEHFMFSGKFTLWTFLAFIIGVIHTIIPQLLPYNSYRIQKDIVDEATPAVDKYL